MLTGEIIPSPFRSRHLAPDGPSTAGHFLPIIRFRRLRFFILSLLCIFILPGLVLLAILVPNPSPDLIKIHLKLSESKKVASGVGQSGGQQDVGPESWAQYTGELVEPASLVRQLSDQIMLAKGYSVLATEVGNIVFAKELEGEIQRARGLLSVSAARQHNLTWQEAEPVIRQMSVLIFRAKEQHYDSASAIMRLRGQVAAMESKLAELKSEVAAHGQVASESIPKPLLCLVVSLSVLAHHLPPPAQSMLDSWQKSPKKDDPLLFHFCIFSDNVLAVAVVVNSLVQNMNASASFPSSPTSSSSPQPPPGSPSSSTSSIVVHVVTDSISFLAMQTWFATHPPGETVMDIRRLDDISWFNESAIPALQQMNLPSFKSFYFDPISAGKDPVKFHNPKYMSPLNHIRFYLPQLYPSLRRIVFLDDDIVVQRDLSPLFSLDLHGNVNGAVETCRDSFHRFHRYLNFSDLRIHDHFDPEGCGWAYGMNIFDLRAWKKANITEIYHFWQGQNVDHTLWKLGTLPPGLLAFYGQVEPLDKSWHVLGLGYNRNLDPRILEAAAVIHYNGNLKPWIKTGIPQYRHYWTKYLPQSSELIRRCGIA